MKKFVYFFLAIVVMTQTALAANLFATVVDTNGKPIYGAMVSYQNGAKPTNASGQVIITNISQNMVWLFTVSADNYNLHTEQLKLTANLSNKTFVLTPIYVEGQATPTAVVPAAVTPTSIPKQPAETAINIRFHITDAGSAAVPLAAVTLLGKMRYTNVYGDVDYPIAKSTQSIDVAIQKDGYSSFTDTYTIPSSLQDDNFRIDVQLTVVNSSTPQIFDKLTKQEQPIKSVVSPSVPGATQRTINYTLPLSLIIVGVIIILLPGNENDNGKQRKRRNIV